MARPSLFNQVKATAVDGSKLKDSPRCWNPGMFRYRDRLWLCYRYHLLDEGGRCQTAIVRLDEKTFQPIGVSQRLMFTSDKGNEHHEDARLFTFRGEPYVSYTEMTGYRPGVDYSCCIKYSKLRLQGNRWSIADTWKPNIGANLMGSKEKNWVFFENDTRLWMIYRDDPDHTVYRMNGAVADVSHVTPKPTWAWGRIRGGTQPVRLDDGSLLVIFHSSVPTEDPPHYVRYHAGAYRMEGAPPFKVIEISRRPIMTGSEQDGHKVDPRYVEGWKPYVVFPCGLVRDSDKLLVSLGINDWQSAVAEISMTSLDLVAADGSQNTSRYFTRTNGSMPVRVIDNERQPQFLGWNIPRPGAGCSVGDGYMEISDQRLASEVCDSPNVKELTRAEYEIAMRPTRR
jgi:predicted GH43/DUF377 family glycosyl hydrolase